MLQGRVETYGIEAVSGWALDTSRLSDDQFVDILDSLVTLTASSTITDNDGDIDSDSETVNIGANLRFYDDGPDISATATTTQIRIDETDNVVASGGETDSPGGNLGTVTMTAASLYTVTTVHESADTPTTPSYALTLSSQGVLSGLLVSSTDTAIRLWNIGGTVYGSTSTTEAGVDTVGLTNVAFTVTINGSGDVTLTQYLGIEHPDTGSHDEDSTPMASGLINVEVTATDFDNDTDAATVDIGSRIVFEDDGPRFGTVDAEININNDATPSSLNNDLQIIIGSDSPNPGNNDVTINDADLTVSVNGTPLDPSDVTITEQSETATTVIYRFSFTYANSPTTETTTFGTLTIHKDTGKYDVVLDAPISGFNIVQTSTEGNTFTGYVPGTSTVDGSQPEVSVTSIVQEAGGDPILFVQFTGDKEPSGGGDHVSVDYDLAAGPDDGDPTTFSEGELVVNDPSWVSTSGSSNGVAGDTIQADEILDFNLYTENPEGNLGMTPTGSATAMFLKFDGIGEAEDLIVILKLMDPDTGEFTTRAVYISNDDIVQGPGTGPGSYAGITLDNNDGLVIIESNDYNGAGENYVIVGAQIMNSEHGLDGEAVDLNSDINVDLNADGDFNDAGESGASDVGSTVPFSSDVDDNAPLKISSIGFVTGGSTDQEAELNFDITIQDADGDTAQQTITVNVGDFPTASEAISTKSTAAVSDSLSTDKSSASVSELISNDNSLTSLDQQMRSMNAANNNAVFLGAIAAAGIGATPAAANHAAFATADFSVGADFMAQSIEPMAASLTVDQPAESMLVAKSATAVQDAAVESAGSSQSASAGSAGDLAGGDAGASAAPVELPGGIDAPVQISAAEIAPAAMTVAMPAAETLVGAKDAGHAVQDAASTGEVARVLADALAGGGNGPSLDAMLDAATGHDAVGSADMLVANWAAAVSHWDMGAFGGFTASHSAVTMDVMTIHPDAGPLTAA